jgi:hypothetical protein
MSSEKNRNNAQEEGSNDISELVDNRFDRNFKQKLSAGLGLPTLFHGLCEDRCFFWEFFVKTDMANITSQT